MPTQTIEGFPLSLQQKRLWSFRANAPEHEFVSEAEYEISGRLDRAIFEKALRAIIERHEICRSIYKTMPGLSEPVQVLEENCDVRASGGARRLEQAPIFDWELKSESAELHRLTVRFPTLAADYTTMELLLENLCEQYQHALAGTADESEPMQYLDYTQWQSELQESPEARSSHRYWRNIPSDQSGYHLPFEQTEKGFASGCEIRSLRAEASEALAPLSVEEKERAICAAWAVFCARLAEINREITIGVYSAGRNFEELHKALGPYDRYLPVVVNLREDATARMMRDAISAGMKAAQQHQEFYSADLLSALSAREEGLAFQFAYRKSATVLRADGLNFQILQGQSHSEPFKLKLEYVEGNAAALRLFYNARLVAADFAAVLADRFEGFLNDFVALENRRVAELKGVTSQEQGMIMEKFVRGESAEPEAATVLDLFESEVTQHPQRPALICGGQMMSYAELNAAANQLANHLAKLGVADGAAVAISAERSFEMIVGLLGIQKAGGAYVPLDPTYPKERLAQVLKDCGAKVLVTQLQLADQLPTHNCRIVLLDAGNGALRQESSENLVGRIHPDRPAYIIYTSGSTGQPKGVPITHRNLAYSTAARFRYYKEPIANYLLLSSFAFDSSIAGIFWSLAQGGTLTLPREGAHQEPQELLRLIADYKVSHLLALPSFYQAILEQASAERVSSLKTVIVAGEACSPELVERHYAKLPNAQFFNEYGPTEGTVWSTVHCCEPDGRRPVPIGRPVPNMSVYILDAALKPVGIGQLGELFIAGPAVASGYLNRPELTAEKFVTTTIYGCEVRLYRTGDLGRFRTDGLIEFHGRIDEQVKIRGYRIELGEIEHLLIQHPDLREAVVVAREDAPGDKKLVAYLVPKENARLSIPDVRLFAQAKLPQFMVPAQFVSLKALPLTPNGKIDRKALPEPSELERNEKRYVAPRNQDEEILARIWSDVLKLEAVGIEENFFDLGGHSLLAIQVIARVRDSFKLDLPMAAFFEAPTIGGMAVALGRCREAKGTGTGGIRRVARVTATDEILAKLNSNPG